MKKLLFLSCLLLIWACYSNDDGCSTDSRNGTQQTAYDLDSNTESLDTSFIEILSIDSCLDFIQPENRNLGVETFFAKKYNEDAYSIRVLGNRMCSPAPPPDQISYSYNRDTLVITFGNKNRTVDVLCACSFWAEILIKGEIDFNYIQLNAIIYAVKKEFDEENN